MRVCCSCFHPRGSDKRICAIQALPIQKTHHIKRLCCLLPGSRVWLEATAMRVFLHHQLHQLLLPTSALAVVPAAVALVAAAHAQLLLFPHYCPAMATAGAASLASAPAVASAPLSCSCYLARHSCCCCSLAAAAAPSKLPVNVVGPLASSWSYNISKNGITYKPDRHTKLTMW